MLVGLKQVIRDMRSGSGVASLEQRLYRRLCLAFGVLLLGVITPMNLLQQLSPWLQVTIALFGVLSWVFYALSYRDLMYVRSYLAVLVLVINLSWFTDAGSSGSIGYFFFAAIVYIGVFFGGAERWTYLTLFMLNGLGLIVIDHLHPEWATPFDSRLDRTVDLLTGFFVSTIGLTMMIWVLRAGYDGERRRQRDLNQRLSEALETNRHHVAQLAASLAEVKTLRGLLPICSNCKSVRDDAGLWTQIEQYVSDHSDALFTHSLCPDCLRKLYPELAESVLAKIKAPEP